MPNRFIRNAVILITKLVGISAFIWQILQFFYAKWTYDWYVEVFLLLLFFMIARYPDKVVGLFNSFSSKISDRVSAKTGGETPENDDEDADA